jgi:hypothetical protein
MWRCLAIAAMLYAFGHPGLDAYRPMAFDRSLQEFHRDVNRVAAVTTRAFVMFDQSRVRRSLNSLSANFQAMLTSH